MREADKDIAAGYSFYYDVIQGYTDFADGKADSISGITCPDPSTVTFNLTAPTGDFNYRVTLAATAPLPAEATKGHDQDYGGFVAATGPYMYKGADKIDYSKPAGQQIPYGLGQLRDQRLVSPPRPGLIWVGIDRPDRCHQLGPDRILSGRG